jgi:hypothetical protein
MSDQDNVKVSLSGKDFIDERDNFGIQDTQILASKDLQNFLLGDPNSVTDIKKDTQVEPDPNQTQNQQSSQSQQTQRDDKGRFLPGKEKQNSSDQSVKDDKSQQQDDKDALDAFIFDNKDDKSNSNSNIVDNQDPANAPQSADDSTYNTLAKDFLRLGVFTKSSEDETEENIGVKTPEEFLDRMFLEKKKGAVSILENFLSQFGEDRRSLFDAIFVNGVDPQEYLNSFAKQEAIGNLDLVQESNQEKIVRAYYKGLKWDDNKIETRIQKLKDYGDLEDEAKAYQEVLINKEKETANEILRKKQVESEEKKFKEESTRKSYHSILAEKLKSKEIDGIPLNERDVQDTLEYLTEKKYKLQSGELLSEFDKDLLELNKPENHELKVKLGVLLKKKLDLSVVQKTAISKKSDALFSLTTKNSKVTQKAQPKSFF